MWRRRFLAAAGGAAAPGTLGGTTLPGRAAASGLPTGPGRPDASALQVLGRTALRLPGSLPGPSLPAATGTFPGIDHIVILMLGGVAMGYWTGADLPFTYSLATEFPIGDRWFSSVLGQTDPNPSSIHCRKRGDWQ